MAKTKMVRFNVKNVAYAVKSEMGVYGTVKELAYANQLTLEPDYSEAKLYGDGIVLGILTSDRGKTGTLGVINLEDHYELDCGRAVEIENGLADVEQLRTVEHAIYYEIDAFSESEKFTIKNWLLGCVTSRANETYNQTETEPTINYYEFPLTVMGDVLLDNAGTEPYEDANGNTMKVFRITVYPEDEGYETFANEVPTPKALGE